jgi:serine/threonine protein phosphatase PrpC
MSRKNGTLENVFKGNKNGFNYASASIRGIRQYNEDRASVTHWNGNSLYMVLDGHGGSECVNMVKRELPLEFKKMGTFNPSTIRRMIIDFDVNRLNRYKENGTTLTALLVTPSKAYIINLGDCRLVHSRGNTVINRSCDHNPRNRKEANRIKKAGGEHIEYIRIGGSGYGLLMSRSLGDYALKNNPNLKPEEQCISCEPDIYVIKLNDIRQNDTITICSDGLFNGSHSKPFNCSEDIASFVNNNINPTQMCKGIMDRCHNSEQGFDNSVVIVIRVKNI